MAPNIKDINRKLIAHRPNDQEKFIEIFKFVADKIYF